MDVSRGGSTPVHAAQAHSAQEQPGREQPGRSRVAVIGTQVAELLTAGASACVVAIPGSGLTGSLEAAHRALLAGGASPDDVLVLTPNRAHADSLRDRLGAGDHAVRTGAGARSVHSLAFGLVSAETATAMGEAAGFLSGADQDAILRTLLDGFESGHVPPPRWPEAFNEEMRRTDAFRDQLREALDSVLVRGIAPIEVEAAAGATGRGEWLALAQILQDYRDQLAFPGYGGVDTSGVLAEAAAIVSEQAAGGAAAGGTWSFSGERIPRYVLVDAAQDVPDAAYGVLAGLSRLGSAVAVFGSPDASTQAFRGAGGLLPDWAAALRSGRVAGQMLTLPARAEDARGAGPVRELCTDLSRRLSAHLGLGHVPTAPAQPGGAHPADGRERAQEGAHAGGSVLRVITHSSAAERTRDLARLIRSWHHDEGVGFSDIAVIARTNGTAVSLRAELGSLGLPVESTDLPLVSDPATAPLLDLLSEDLHHEEARGDLLRRLLTGVYGGVDALALRGMEREAVRALRAAAVEPGSRPLLTWADTASPAALPAPLARAVAMVERGLEHRGSSPHTALWSLWQTAGVAEPWRREVLRDPRSPLRERLDAVVRLFALAKKLEDTVGLQADAFAGRVREQVYAQDSLSRTDSLDLVTVDSPAGVSHSSFSRVAVVDVDEGSWPNPRIRRNAFHPDELVAYLSDPEAALQESAPGEAMKEARRRTVRDEGGLFLAAVSRARDELVVCALDDGDTSPSAFHHLAREYATAAGPGGEAAAAEGPGAAGGTETAAGELVPARLRDIAGLARQELLEAEEPAEWAALVAALGAAGLREADPATWSTWFEVSSDTPARDPDERLRIRPSQVETFATCPLQWFLTENGGRPGETAMAASLGTAMHQVAEHHTEPDREAMLAEFEQAFDYSRLDSDWERDRTRAEAVVMVDTLIDYLRYSRADMARRAQQAGGAEAAVHTEAQVSAASPAGARGGPWRIGGRADRLERVGSTVRVVDFKTGKVQPSKQEVRDNPQLAVYQYAIAEGEIRPAGDGQPLRGAVPAGGALVHLRRGVGTGREGLPTYLREQPAMGADTELGEQMLQETGDLVDTVAVGMRQARFPATPGRHCEHCPVRSSCPAQTALTAEGGEG